MIWVDLLGLCKCLGGLEGGDDFLASQNKNINQKFGEKIGQGRLPFESSKAGVEQAKLTVKETLENVAGISDVIPSSSVRGDYDLIHVYGSKAGSVVSLRAMLYGSYAFDTLIPEGFSKF